QIGSVNLPPSRGAYLNEADLPKIKGIFWRNNIAAFAPELPVNVRVGTNETTLLGTYFAKRMKFGNQEFVTGARTAFPWWKIEGNWPADDSGEVLVGERLASHLGLHAGSEVAINDGNHR